MGAVVGEAIAIGASPAHQLARQRRQRHDQSSQSSDIQLVYFQDGGVRDHEQRAWISPVLLHGRGLCPGLCHDGLGELVRVVRHGRRRVGCLAGMSDNSECKGMIEEMKP